MLNRATQFGLTALCSILLTACGGGGGSGDSHYSAGEKKVDTTTTITTVGGVVSTNTTISSSTTLIPNNGDVNLNNSTTYYTGQKQTSNGENVVYEQLNTADLKTISIGGQIIQLDKAGSDANRWVTAGNENTCCGAYENVKIGGIFGTQSYLFYNGTPTTAMPTTGAAKYEGDFLYYAKAREQYELSSPATERKATFEVDFANKTITGELNGTMSLVTLDGKFTGNVFSGEAISVNETQKGQFNGQFYGKEASQLGGMAAAGNASWSAVFAAKQVNK